MSPSIAYETALAPIAYPTRIWVILICGSDEFPWKHASTIIYRENEAKVHDLAPSRQEGREGEKERNMKRQLKKRRRDPMWLPAACSPGTSQRQGRPSMSHLYRK